MGHGICCCKGQHCRIYNMILWKYIKFMNCSTVMSLSNFASISSENRSPLFQQIPIKIYFLCASQNDVQRFQRHQVQFVIRAKSVWIRMRASYKDIAWWICYHYLWKSKDIPKSLSFRKHKLLRVIWQNSFNILE